MRILIINGHPYAKSFNHALAERYAQGARAGGHEVKLVHLSELKFDPVLRFGYSKRMTVEKDLKPQQDWITWCEHFVVVTPVWWLARPSLLQGYFERVLTPGFAYNHHKGLFSFYPIRRLKGRSARVIYTQDGPKWIYSLVLRGAFWVALKRGVLWYCGFSPVKRICLRDVSASSDKKRERWLRLVERLGRRGK
jgi:putative NADPH-quinone reductase